MVPVFLTLDADVETDANTLPRDESSQLQIRYGVEFRHSVDDVVTAYYDTTVTVSPGTCEETITGQAADIVAERVPGATVDDLSLACSWLEAVVLDRTRREAMPTPVTAIECGDHVRYTHDGLVCTGRILDISLAQDTTLEIAILATRIGGSESAEHAVHHVPLSVIDAPVEQSGT